MPLAIPPTIPSSAAAAVSFNGRTPFELPQSPTTYFADKATSSPPHPSLLFPCPFRRGSIFSSDGSDFEDVESASIAMNLFLEADRMLQHQHHQQQMRQLSHLPPTPSTQMNTTQRIAPITAPPSPPFSSQARPSKFLFPKFMFQTAPTSSNSLPKSTPPPQPSPSSSLTTTTTKPTPFIHYTYLPSNSPPLLLQPMTLPSCIDVNDRNEVPPLPLIHPCPHPGCGRKFRRLFNMKSHLVCHSGDRPHACTTCSATFRRKHDLQRHFRSSHTKQQPFRCTICLRGFTRKDHFNRHMKLEEKKKIDVQ